MRLLTRSDIARAISMPEAVEAAGRAYAQLSMGHAEVPPRIVISSEKYAGVTLFMPGALTGEDAMAIKIVSVHDRNPERGLPLIHGLVIVIDPATGRPLAAMEGGHLTALRTGAGSGAATDLLARGDAKTAAIFGAGIQARTQLLAVAAVREIRRFWIYSPRLDRVEAMIQELRPQLDASIELRAAESPSRAVRDAEIICAATTSATPVFSGEDLKPGAHVNAVGSFRPHIREVDALTLQRASKIVVDSMESAMAEAGDILMAIDEGAIPASKIHGEIGEIGAGLKPGREDDQEITFFKSVGNAAQDVATAHAIYRRSLEENLGIDIDLEA
ncbi:MAG: ornithine cyclodeaminase family protein [Blastocatellia bacterium]